MDQSDLTASINYRHGSSSSNIVTSLNDLPPPIISMGPGSAQICGNSSVHGNGVGMHSHGLKSPTSHTQSSGTSSCGSYCSSTVLHHNSEKHALALLEALHGLRHFKNGSSSSSCVSSTDVTSATNTLHAHSLSGSSGTGNNILLDTTTALCDVTLSVNQRRIPAHKVVLAACSPYFRAMFTGELAESRQTEITLHDMDENAVESLVEYCYTAQITVEVGNVQNLLPAACLLQMQDIQDVCCQFLKKQLDPSNCLGIRAFADTHACRELLQEADRYTLKNFQEVIESEEFLLLPLSQLLELVHCDELGVDSEEQVYQAVMRWVRHNLPERRRHLPTVLQHVRLPLLSAKFLVGTVGQDTLIRGSEQCRDLVDEAKNYLLLPQERPLMQGPRTRPRRPCGEVLFAVGGWCNGDAINTVERFDPLNNEWRQVAPMCKRRCGVGVAVVQDLLYAIGGHDGQSYLNSVERYDPHTNQWSTDAAPTSSCRTSVGVAVLDRLMYAVGGQDGVSCLNYVECYDPIVNVWTKVSNMNSPRLGVGVAVLNGALYAVGGSDGSRPLNSVEMLDPRVGRWKDVSPMNTRRKHLGVSVHMSNLYAVGGRDDSTELSSAEFYDPRIDAWCPVVAMTSRRSGVGLAVVNGHLVAVGGFDGCMYLRTVEQYDDESRAWRQLGSMQTRRLGGGVGVVRVASSSLDL